MPKKDSSRLTSSKEMGFVDPFLFDSGDGEFAGVDESGNLAMTSSTSDGPSTLTSQPTSGAISTQHFDNNPQTSGGGSGSDGTSCPEGRQNQLILDGIRENLIDEQDINNAGCLDNKAEIANFLEGKRAKIRLIESNLISATEKSADQDFCDEAALGEISSELRSLETEVNNKLPALRSRGCCGVNKDNFEELFGILNTTKSEFKAAWENFIFPQSTEDIEIGIFGEEQGRLQIIVNSIVDETIVDPDQFIAGCPKTLAEMKDMLIANLAITEFDLTIRIIDAAVNLRRSHLSNLQTGAEFYDNTIVDVFIGAADVVIAGILGSGIAAIKKVSKAVKSNVKDFLRKNPGLATSMAAFAATITAFTKDDPTVSDLYEDVVELFDITGEIIETIGDIPLTPFTSLFNQRESEIDEIIRQLTDSENLLGSIDLNLSSSILRDISDEFSDLYVEHVAMHSSEFENLDDYVEFQRQSIPQLTIFLFILVAQRANSESNGRLSAIFGNPDSRLSGSGGDPVSFAFASLPIAHESADCIGEQCGVGSRLRYRVRVIQPGRSLNNYHYAPEMLESSAALLEGVPVQAYGYGQYQPMFSHLPQDLEPVQPSGFALNRVGILTDAAYESHDQFGEGLFATLIVDKTAEGWARSILDEATTPGGNGTGVSIFVDIDGDYEYDPVNDDLFVRVDAIKHFRSVDLASSPAAGGAIVSALEDACVNERTRMASLLWWINTRPPKKSWPPTSDARGSFLKTFA